MAYKIVDYAEVYRNKHLCTLSLGIANTSVRAYFMFDEDFEKSCKEHGIEMKYTLNGMCGTSPFAEVREISDKSKEENPLCSYVLEKIQKLFIDEYAHNIQIEPGFYSYGSETIAHIDLDELIEELTEKYFRFMEQEEQTNAHYALLKHAKETVKFKTDALYPLVKPKKTVLKLNENELDSI